MQIKIVHCKGRRFVSKAISFFTRSYYTHSAIYFELGGNAFIVEMQRKGFQLISFDNWISKYNYKYKMTDVDENFSITDIFCYAGVSGYDFELLIVKNIWKAIWQFVTGRKYKIKRDPNGANKMICSELVARVMRWEDPQNYTPGDIYKKCLK